MKTSSTVQINERKAGSGVVATHPQTMVNDNKALKYFSTPITWAKENGVSASDILRLQRDFGIRKMGYEDFPSAEYPSAQGKISLLTPEQPNLCHQVRKLGGRNKKYQRTFSQSLELAESMLILSANSETLCCGNKKNHLLQGCVTVEQMGGGSVSHLPSLSVLVYAVIDGIPFYELPISL
ncbi:hypothetical protein J6590_076615 [Homalodisca vitripennis]|nr:hypothetical protein J6590_076615 [Homalodisca vitripennis]